MTDVDPQEAARIATETHTESEGIPGDVSPPEPEPDSSRGSSVVDGLLETDPDSSVREYQDLSEPAANMMIGTVKFLNGILGDDRAVGGGKPALVNFLQAALGFVSDSDSSSGDPKPEPEPEPDTPAGAIGGEINE